MLDVGANDGPYGAALRAVGYQGRIVSFEPQSEAFARLSERSRSDDLWECRRVALGSAPGNATLNVAANSSSSSLLAIVGRHLVSAPESRTVGRESVQVETVDDNATSLLASGERLMLKLDVQGYELEVLRGAETTLPRVDLLEVELSLSPLYDGAPLLPAVLEHVVSCGFDLLGLEPVFLAADGVVLQVDGLFGRTP